MVADSVTGITAADSCRWAISFFMAAASEVDLDVRNLAGGAHFDNVAGLILGDTAAHHRLLGGAQHGLAVVAVGLAGGGLGLLPALLSFELQAHVLVQAGLTLGRFAFGLLGLLLGALLGFLQSAGAFFLLLLPLLFGAGGGVLGLAQLLRGLLAGLLGGLLGNRAL